MVPPKLTLVPKGDNCNDADPEANVAALPDEPYGSAEDIAKVAEVEASAVLPDNVSSLPSADHAQALRIVEAMLFAAEQPLDEAQLAQHVGDVAEIGELMEELGAIYAHRGVNLVQVAGKWAFRTAPDLGFLLERHRKEERRLSKAALETLSIIAYHQPVTRAEIEEIRGVSTSKGTIDVLMETTWIRPRGRRRAPGRPVTYGTTEAFLSHFGLSGIKDLPGLAELKGAGLLDSNLPPDFQVPAPEDVAALTEDELPLEEEDDEDLQAELALDEEAAESDGDFTGEASNDLEDDADSSDGDEDRCA